MKPEEKLYLQSSVILEDVTLFANLFTRYDKTSAWNKLTDVVPH